MSAGAGAGLALFTTTNLADGRTDEVARMFASVEAFRASRPDVSVHHSFLVQSCTDVAQARTALGVPDWVEVSVVDRLTPLSRARNMMLASPAAQAAIGDASVVAFPDDDCWFPAGSLEAIFRRFEDNPRLDFHFCRYGTTAAHDPQAAAVRPSYQTVLSYGSSNTIMLRGRLQKLIGGFDEGLGLGTPMRSGEDTELAARAYFCARETLFVDARLIGHRDFSAATRARYFPGTVVAIARHMTASPAATKALLRKLAVGCVLMARRELPAKDFSGAIRAALADRRLRRAEGLPPIQALRAAASR